DREYVMNGIVEYYESHLSPSSHHRRRSREDQRGGCDAGKHRVHRPHSADFLSYDGTRTDGTGDGRSIAYGPSPPNMRYEGKGTSSSPLSRTSLRDNHLQNSDNQSVDNQYPVRPKSSAARYNGNSSSHFTNSPNAAAAENGSSTTDDVYWSEENYASKMRQK